MSKRRIPIERIGAIMKVVLTELKNAGGQASFDYLLKKAKPKLNLSEYEKEHFIQSDYARWQAKVHYYSIDCMNANYIKKMRGNWILTKEGEEALKDKDRDFIRLAKEKYLGIKPVPDLEKEFEIQEAFINAKNKKEEILVIKNRFFVIDKFQINKNRDGFIEIGRKLSEIQKQDLRILMVREECRGFNVWDYSGRLRTIWHLQLTQKKMLEDHDIYHFEYKRSIPEKIVAELLIKKEVNFYEQYPISGFLVDFFIWPDVLLEIDGPYHFSPERRIHDLNKDKILRSKGWKVHRIGFPISDEMEKIEFKGFDEEKYPKFLNDRLDQVLAIAGMGILCNKSSSCNLDCHNCWIGHHYAHIEFLKSVSPRWDICDENYED